MLITPSSLQSLTKGIHLQFFAMVKTQRVLLEAQLLNPLTYVAHLLTWYAKL